MANNTPHVHEEGVEALSTLLKGDEFGRVCTPCFILERDNNVSICANCEVFFGIIGGGEYQRSIGEELCDMCNLSHKMPEPYTSKDALSRKQDTMDFRSDGCPDNWESPNNWLQDL